MKINKKLKKKYQEREKELKINYLSLFLGTIRTPLPQQAWVNSLFFLENQIFLCFLNYYVPY
jgi:hypothetical protein